MARIYVGTSSWADHSDFYPPGLPSNQEISYYAARFPIVEINSTYYRPMPARNFRLWAERTPPDFIFDVKPFKQLTWHDRATPPTPEAAHAFSASLEPLREAGKVGALHFQFPPWFTYGPENLAYVRQLPEVYAPDRVAVEFRHRSWLEGEHVPELVRALGESAISLTVVDEPQVGSGSVPTLLAVSRPELVLVRLHGRNAKMWYARVKSTAERFDYFYSEEELREWVPRIGTLAEQAAEIHVFFNNNAQDYAVRNASQLRLMLREGLPQADVVRAAIESEPQQGALM
jgi:uncharacterized protein YecE (DUF72 family)